MQQQDAMKSLIATSVAHFLNDGTLYIFITLFPKLLPSEYFLTGVLLAIQNFFSVAVSPFIGRRTDSVKNYGRVLSLGLVIMGIGTVGYSISVLIVSGFSLFLFLVPFSIIAGIGSSVYHPLGAAVLNQKWRGQILGRAMGVNGAIGSFGRAIYPLFVVGLVVAFGIPSVAVLAVLVFGGAALVSSLLHGMSFGKDQSGMIKGDSKKTNAQKVPMNLILPKVLALTIIAFTRGLFSVGLVSFIQQYLIQVRNLQYSIQLGIVFAFMLGMAILGQPVFGYIADRFGRRLSLGLSIVGSGVAMLLFLNVGNPILSSICLGLFGFFGLTGFPLLLPLATTIVPEGAQTISGSIVWGVGNVGGGAAGPFIIGLLAEPMFLGSLSSAFYVVTIIGIASLGILPFVPKPRAR